MMTPGTSTWSAIPICQLPNCGAPVHVDPATGQIHDFCRKSHADQFSASRRQQQPQQLRTVVAVMPAAPAPRITNGSGGIPKNKRKTGIFAAIGSIFTGVQRGNQSSNTQHQLPAPRQQQITAVAVAAAAPIAHGITGGVVAPGVRVTNSMVFFWQLPCCFTQWAPSPFVVDKVWFKCSNMLSTVLKL